MKHRFIEAKGVVADKAGSMVKMVTETIKAHPLITVGSPRDRVRRDPPDLAATR